MRITVRYPLRAVDSGTLTTVVVGGAETKQGQVVHVHDTFNRARYDSVVIRNQETVSLREISPEWLAKLGSPNVKTLNDGLSRCYGTVLPKKTTITAYEFEVRK